jgi:hypothetical protein
MPRLKANTSPFEPCHFDTIEKVIAAGPDIKNICQFRRNQTPQWCPFCFRIYRILRGMRSRCENSNQIGFAYYGGRGIRVCEKWTLDFREFRRWALLNDYQPDLSIDRINVNGDYEPGNCRFATPQMQTSNRRRNAKRFRLSGRLWWRPYPEK